MRTVVGVPDDVAGEQAGRLCQVHGHLQTIKPALVLGVVLGVLAANHSSGAAAELFRDDFHGRLADGWSWVREQRSAWRVTDRALEIRALPGNMWGPPNNASNVLVRPLPQAESGELEVAVTLENRPTEQYEQTDLVWYYDDSHMVKLGQELVDGKLSIVMGREEKDKTRTIAIVPLESFQVRVRFHVKGNTIRGEFQSPGQEKWTKAGECDLPVKGEPKASLQVYQGPKSIERWARFTEFRIVQRKL